MFTFFNRKGEVKKFLTKLQQVIIPINKTNKCGGIYLWVPGSQIFIIQRPWRKESLNVRLYIVYKYSRKQIWQIL